MSEPRDDYEPTDDEWCQCGHPWAAHGDDDGGWCRAGREPNPPFVVVRCKCTGFVIAP